MEKQYEYEKIFAINEDLGTIIKLKGHGYAMVDGAEKSMGQDIHVADFAMDFLKFDPYGCFKKVKSDAEIPDRVIENVKYNLINAKNYYGVLHPGLKMAGIE